MRKYRVNVNGTAYEVMIEEIGSPSAGSPRTSAEHDSSPIRPAAPTRASVPAPVPARPAAPAHAPEAPAATAPAGGEQITAPMPGNILDVCVSNGQNVKKGDVLMVLEAMKMENDITSPCDGAVQSVGVSKGASVTSGALLCVIQ